MIKLIKRYHPERHYMRGAGPKWLEKHSGGIGTRHGRLPRSQNSVMRFFFQFLRDRQE
jgi:hypothetical protein